MNAFESFYELVRRATLGRILPDRGPGKPAEQLAKAKKRQRRRNKLAKKSRRRNR